MLLLFRINQVGFVYLHYLLKLLRFLDCFHFIELFSGKPIYFYNLDFEQWNVVLKSDSILFVSEIVVRSA